MKNNEQYIVYKATNKKTGMSYIGATTKSVEERRADHLQKANKESGSYFQRAILTYGPDAFRWEQVDTATSINELAYKEKQYILMYDTRENGYNSDLGGGFRKEVYMFDLNGTLLAKYLCLKELELLGFDRRRISGACLSAKPYNGRFWSYIQYAHFSNPKKSNKKKVEQCNLQLETIEIYSSVSEASIMTGVSKTCISRCCRGERSSSGGSVWFFI